MKKHRAFLMRFQKRAGSEKDLALRTFHTLPRRNVMEKCALNVTETHEVKRVFTKVMVQTPVVSPIMHRNGAGNMVQGTGPNLVIKEAVSDILTAEGNSATAAEVRGWMADMIPREERVLSNGVDIVFLNQLLAAVEKLKTDPNIAPVCKQMADECHKPAPSIDVEMGEFLYGLADSFNIIKEAHDRGMVVSRVYSYEPIYTYIYINMSMTHTYTYS